ncbi:hypothetical protein C345_02003 [Cryptococcus neoformans A2-102-5]|nr:hypothetical protein C345_02003 [Cryptococcus neoformans var. grubii A2-102-5]
MVSTIRSVRSTRHCSKNVTTVVSVSAAYLTACSSLASFTYPAMEAEFGVSRLVCTLSVSLFVLGMAIGPLLTGPISEFTGRRRVLLCSIVCNFLLNIPVAFANNISVHLVFRFLSGFAGAAFGAVSGGVISDVFPNKKVGTPMIIFTTVMLIGPVIGAIISALINANANWRWTYITVIIWAFVLSVLVYFLVPETSAAQLLTQKARRRRRETGEGKWQSPAEREDRSVLLAFRHSLGTPFVLLSTQMMVLFLDLWSSLILGILYLSFGGIPYMFTTQYHFTTLQSGLAFIGIGLGELFAIVVQLLLRGHYRHVALSHGGTAPPEVRLVPGMYGALIAPLGLLLLGTTSLPKVPWIIPILGSTFFGCGLVLALSSTFTYLIDAYRPVAASALSSNNFLRAVFACAFPLFGHQFYNRLGVTAGTCVLAGLLFAAAPLPFIFYKIGPRIRARSPYSNKVVTLS